MSKKANAMLDVLKRECGEMTEALLEDICELCHHPYVITDQQELEERCAECTISWDLEALLTRQRTVTTGEIMAIVAEEMHKADNPKEMPHGGT